MWESQNELVLTDGQVVCTRVLDINEIFLKGPQNPNKKKKKKKKKKERKENGGIW